MDRPEEKQESLQGDDHGEGSADPGSAGSAELKNKTDKSPGPETLWAGEPQGDSVPEATIIPEDATPPKGPSEPEKNLEESKPLRLPLAPPSELLLGRNPEDRCLQGPQERGRAY